MVYLVSGIQGLREVGEGSSFSSPDFSLRFLYLLHLSWAIHYVNRFQKFVNKAACIVE